MHQIKLNRYHCSFKDPFFTKLLLMTTYYYVQGPAEKPDDF